MSELLKLLNQRLLLVEESRNDKFRSIRLYTETLPSLLVQSIGLLERRMQDFNDSTGQRDPNKHEFTNLDSEMIKKFKKKFGIPNSPWLVNDKSKYQEIIMKYYRVIKYWARIEKKQEIRFIIKRLSLESNRRNSTGKSYFNIEFINDTLCNAIKHRDDFAHAHINKRPLSVIACTDYYIYFGVLLYVEYCIEKIIADFYIKKTVASVVNILL